MSQIPDWNAPGAAPQYQQAPGQALPQTETMPVPGQAAPAIPVPAAMPGMPMPGAAGMPAPPGMYLDQQSGLVLPMGTTLASPGLRIGAYFLGGVLYTATLWIGYWIWGAITWSKGQTPTQQLLKTRYWNPSTRTTATWGTMALGQIVGRLVDYIALWGIVSFFMMLASREHRTLYDHICGCVVLHDPNGVLDPALALQAPQVPAA